MLRSAVEREFSIIGEAISQLAGANEELAAEITDYQRPRSRLRHRRRPPRLGRPGIQPPHARLSGQCPIGGPVARVRPPRFQQPIHPASPRPVLPLGRSSPRRAGGGVMEVVHPGGVVKVSPY